MKKLLLGLLLSLFCFNGFAQDPELFRTWYLTFIEVDLGDEIFVTNISPSISPTLTINELLEFNGDGACNGFGGEFTFGEANGYDSLTPTEFFATLLICDYEEHTDFESAYFSFFEFEEPLMILNIETTHLALEGLAGFILHYSNEPLAIENYLVENINIYPNPVSSTLFISSENKLIDTINIYSLTGKKVLKVSKGENSIDVSSLSKGMYFIEIFSESGKTVKKFIKK